MEGSFQGLQNGFAVAHGVNLISANGDAGGSGIWPANASAAAVQYPTSARSAQVPQPQWFGTLELVSPTGALVEEAAVPPPSSHRLISNISQFTIPAVTSGYRYSTIMTLPGTTCHFELSSATAGSRYLFGATNGINFAGLFESTCWLVGCDTIANKIYGQASPTFLEQAFWPFTDDDVDFCANTAQVFVGAQVRIDINTASTTNFFIPDAQCSNGTVPWPRPVVKARSQNGWRKMSVTSDCALGIVAVRSFAQSEFELPQCPEGFCPSPSICTNQSWETDSNGMCVLVNGVPRNSTLDEERIKHAFLV